VGGRVGVREGEWEGGRVGERGGWVDERVGEREDLGRRKHVLAILCV